MKKPNNISKQFAVRARSGFTLVEMLVTLAVVSMITVLLATGVSFAMNQYANTKSLSEAKILHSTLKSIISNELATTEEITLGAASEQGGRVLDSFHSKHYSAESADEQGAGANKAGSQFKIIGADSSSGDSSAYGEVALGAGDDQSKWVPLLSSAAYPYGLGAKVRAVYYDKTASRPSFFRVYLTIANAAGDPVVDESFDVSPYNGIDITDDESG